MEAVRASTLVAISAFFRVLFAQKMAGMFDLRVSMAFSLVVLSIYTLDRSFDYKSNEGLALSLIFMSAAISLSDNRIIPLLALFIGFMYSKGIKGFKLKKGYGIKNSVTASTWGAVIAFYSKIDGFIIAFFTVKSFIITVLNDFKDLDDDLKKGIRTVPAILRERTVYFLLFVHFTFHGLIFCFLPLIPYLFSLLAGLFCIWKIKPKIAQTEFMIQSFLIELSNA
jgi:4-hydroxybenzoate polyprenyltransferase